MISILAALLLAAAPGVPQVQGNANGTPLPTLVPDTLASGSVSGPCADANIQACGATSTVAVALAGSQGCGFTVPAASTLVGTLKADYLGSDNTTWFNTSLLDIAGNATSSLAASTTTAYFSSVAVPSGARQCRVRASAWTSGSGTLYAISTTTPALGNAIQGNGTAGTPSTGAMTIQGITGMTPVSVTQTGVTPVTCTISTACSTGQSCAATSHCDIAVASESSIGMQITATSSPTGITLVVDTSVDGTNWPSNTTGTGLFDSGATLKKTTTLTAFNNSDYYNLIPSGGAGTVRVRATALTSGTVTVQLGATDLNDPSVIFGTPGGATSAPPAYAAVAAQDAVTATTMNPIRSVAPNNTAGTAPGLLVMGATARTASPAYTAGNVATPSMDVTGAQNVILGTVGTVAQIGAANAAIGNGVTVFGVKGGTLGTTNALTNGNIGAASADTAGVLYVNGKIATNTALTNANPVYIGGEAQGSALPTAATAGNGRHILVNLDGAQYVQPGSPLLFSGGVTAIAATLTQVVAAPAAGTSLYLTDITAVSDTATAGQFTLRYGTGANCVTGTTTNYPNVAALTTGKIPYPGNTANNPLYVTFTTPLKVPAANALCVICVATNTCTVHVQGFTAP